MIEVREFLDRQGRNPYKVWFDRLNAQAAGKVATAVTKLSLGNISNVKGIGSGVFELRIDFGPGCWIYFGKDDERLASASPQSGKHCAGRGRLSNHTDTKQRKLSRVDEDLGREAIRLTNRLREMPPVYIPATSTKEGSGGWSSD